MKTTRNEKKKEGRKRVHFLSCTAKKSVLRKKNQFAFQKKEIKFEDN